MSIFSMFSAFCKNNQNSNLGDGNSFSFLFMKLVPDTQAFYRNARNRVFDQNFKRDENWMRRKKTVDNEEH